MVIGNIWVDLLNNVVKQVEGEVDVKTRLINSLIWPYSIYHFMKEIELKLNGKQNIGDIPDTMNDMVNAIDKHMAEKLGCSLEVYRNVMDTKCTDEEVEDIVGTIIGNVDEDEVNRVKKLFKSKIEK
jgi:uncharacterized protein YejL (UPF0352 family)